MSAVLQCSDLAKSFVAKRSLIGRAVDWNRAVKGVSMDAARGETVGLVGESGAGKSTVGRLILRLIEPDTGQIEIAGTDLRQLKPKELREFRSRARMIFQDPYSSLDPTKTIADIIGAPLDLHMGLKRNERDERVAELLQRVGLTSHHMDRHPYEFSGGQLQRIAVARAISTNPDVIVCDEPVAALDMSIRAHVINLLRDLQTEYGMAYVFISHDLSLVGLIAHRVAVMYRGRIVEIGDTDQLFANPLHPYTKTLLAAIPIPGSTRRRDERVTTPRGAENQLDLPGCDYADRCPSVMDVCRKQRPVLQLVEGMEVACHLYGETSGSPTGTDHEPVAVAVAPPGRRS